jgi:transposase
MGCTGLFIDELNIAPPAYHPAVFFKVYIYDYFNQIQSSHRLEREAQLNIELMWLTNRLAPDFKMITRFRKNNHQAVCSVYAEFVMLCKQLPPHFEHSCRILHPWRFKPKPLSRQGRDV